MPTQPNLTDEQRAVLSLLLRRRKRYEQIASALSLSEREVRSRAQQALSALAPAAAAGCSAEELAQVCDLLLDQLDPAQRLIAYDRLEDSAAAGALMAELQPALKAAAMSSAPPAPAASASPAPAASKESTAPALQGPVPTAPAAAKAQSPAEKAPYSPSKVKRQRILSKRPGRQTHSDSAAQHRPAARADRPDDRPQLSAAVPAESPDPQSRTADHRDYGSRRGGALLLTALVGGLILVLYIAGVFGGGEGGTASTSASGNAAVTSTGTATSHSAAAATQEARIQLHSPGSATQASGEAIVASTQGKRELALEAKQLLPPGKDFYVVWLYNSESHFEAVGRAKVLSEGKLPASVIEMPANAPEFHNLIITRESLERPTHPGEIVLSGNYSLH